LKEGLDKRQIEFKIDASRCWLRVGDPVTPDTVIGIDATTRKVIKAGQYGRVTGILFSGGEHTLTILIQMYHICPMPKTRL
jgi:high-affinity nickel permease